MKDRHILSTGKILIEKDFEEVREEVGAEFSIVVEQRVISRKGVLSGVGFRCEEVEDVNAKFERLAERLRSKGFTTFIRGTEGGVWITVRKKEERGTGELTLKHLLLFFATILTTLAAGSLLFGVNPLKNPLLIFKGWPFSASIMLVLGMHELGHYIISKRRSVVATPPYFIPVPPPFILGTLGAVIRMKSPMPDRDSMFDIGVAGPLLGVAFAIPITLIGLYLSPIPIPEEATPFRLGRPLIYWALSSLTHAGEGGLHPVAFAGWVGFFVTFLNLLPVGQLDGGHIFRAMFGEAHEKISRAIPIFLLMMGFSMTFFLGVNGGIWIFWGFISMFFHGAGHPPPMNDVKPLDTKRKAIGILVLFLMVACFTPIPFSVPSA